MQSLGDQLRLRVGSPFDHLGETVDFPQCLMEPIVADNDQQAGQESSQVASEPTIQHVCDLAPSEFDLMVLQLNSPSRLVFNVAVSGQGCDGTPECR